MDVLTGCPLDTIISSLAPSALLCLSGASCHLRLATSAFASASHFATSCPQLGEWEFSVAEWQSVLNDCLNAAGGVDAATWARSSKWLEGHRGDATQVAPDQMRACLDFIAIAIKKASYVMCPTYV